MEKIFDDTDIIDKLNKIDARLEKLEKFNNKIENLIKFDMNLIFKYISKGIEIHPGDSCERVVIDDYHQVLIDKERYPDYYRDHVNRYLFAKQYIQKNDNVLDIACGTGYGSRIIKDETELFKITGVDISQSAVDFCNVMYKNQGLEFISGNALNNALFEENTYDKIISFETLEHVSELDLKDLLANYLKWLKQGGKLICSTPNEAVCHFMLDEKTARPYHHKHYYAEELVKIVKEAGFKNIELVFQDTYCYGGRFKKEDEKNRSHYIIIIAQKS